MDEVLIVEDDQDIAELMAVSLKVEGFSCRICLNAEAALAAIRDSRFALCVLDLMLPGMDGLSLLKTLRSMRLFDPVPIIIASARDDDSDIVAGLELGADDYIVKPFSPKVLAARLRALLRRFKASGRQGEGADVLVADSGRLVLDPSRHEVKADGISPDLSATEFAVLRLLMGKPGRVYTREQIIEAVKGADYPVTDRAIDVHILAIRRKLGELGPLVETVRGIGYRFRDEG
jgi:two-component system, OmpR family, alkaline phosphatase synthesis response regulator PhoP